MIKKIVLIAAMGTVGFLWGSGDVTVQVINAVKESSITPEFDKKLAKTALRIHKVVEDGRHIVTLGAFKDEKSAHGALKKARKIVDAGAFVRLVNREHAAAPHEAAKSVHAAVAVHETPAVREVAVVATPKEEHLVLVEVKPVVVEVKNSLVSTVVASSASEKKEAYLNEIAEAINFYRNSPYHRFEPVMLQQ